MPTPDFILNLRKKIGHEPLWLIGVTAYLEDSHGRILFERRADNGMWALVSGINEPGEDPAVTVAREMREEAGIDVDVTELAAVKADPQVLTYPNGDQCQYLDLLFICELRDASDAGNARVSDDENLELGWFEPDRLPDPVTASSLARMDLARKFLARRDGGNPRTLFETA